MSKDSAEPDSDLPAALTGALFDLSIAIDLIGQAAASRLGINQTDLICLDLLVRQGPMGAGHLAAALGLTTAAISAMATASICRCPPDSVRASCARRWRQRQNSHARIASTTVKATIATMTAGRVPARCASLAAVPPLAKRIGALTPGSKVSVSILRKGEQKTLTLALEPMPNDRQAKADAGATHAEAGDARPDRPCCFCVHVMLLLGFREEYHQ